MTPALDPQACLDTGWQVAPDLLLRLALMAGLLALAGWSRVQRYFPGQPSFQLLLLMMVAWLALTTLGHAATEPVCKATMAVAAWPVILGLTALWALFLHQYAHTEAGLPPHLSAPVLLLWAGFSLAALSNGAHGWLYGPGSGPEVTADGLVRMRYERGPLFAPFATWGYVWLLAAMAVLVRAWRQATLPDDRRQWTTFMAMMSVPLIASVAFVGFDWRLLGGDPTPLSLGAALVGLGWLVRRRRLFTAVPLARQLLFAELPDPVLVLDAQGRVRDANRAAERLAGQAIVAGGPLADWPRIGAPLAAALAQTPPPPLLRLEGPPQVYEISLRDVAAGGHVLGRLLQLRDVTGHHLAQARLAQTLDQRDAQLRQVAALQHELREQALRDPLTGLHNRRALQARFAQGVTAPFVLALVDVDHFKRINDSAGHAVGDRVLQALAQRLQAGLRRDDEVYRVGGEEFLVLLPGAGLAAALQRLEALRQQVAGEALVDPVGRVTISIGVAAATAAGATLDPLYAAADAALYRAKAEGRDRVRAA